jgi:phosphoribosylglycinamide formyltransferase-1
MAGLAQSGNSFSSINCAVAKFKKKRLKNNNERDGYFIIGKVKILSARRKVILFVTESSRESSFSVFIFHPCLSQDTRFDFSRKFCYKQASVAHFYLEIYILVVNSLCMKKQNIVFVGFRGAGKSKYGRELARIIGLPFADLDEEVEFVLGESIHEFVEKHGWQVFREVEQRVTHDFARNFSGIIATGGGTIENSKNLQNLKKTSSFVFVNPQFEKVKKYLLTDEAQKNRPRINSAVTMGQEIDQLWTQRKDIYAAIANIEVNPDYDANVQEESKKILSQIPKSIWPSIPKKRSVAIFSSSRGSSMQGVIDAQKRGRIPNVEFSLFVTDKPEMGALEKAKKSGVFKKIEVLEAHSDETREEYDRALINLAREAKPDVILLAGWMRILSKLYCEQFGSQTYNVHPSLLPKYGGMKGDDVHSAVLNDEERYTGCTVHTITENVDNGEVVVQRKIPVDPSDTIESLRHKVQKQEVLGFCEALEKRK